MEISGIWLPIITPFVDGEVDLASYETMLTHYLGRGVRGIFPLGTTGESPTIDEDEMEAIVDCSINLTNETLLRLAELPNIVGAKDSSGNLSQSLELLRLRPKGFAVLTGDDASLYTMLAHGGDGGILASSHVRTEQFVAVYERMRANDHRGARAIWSPLETLVPLLFKEANPMPIKHCVWREGLIASPQCRLPLTRISTGLADELDRALKGEG